MKEGYWVVRTYESGSVGEKTKFWVQGVRPNRASRRLKSEIKKQEQNEHSAEKRLARAINANFGPGSALIGLDYSPEGMKRLLGWTNSQEVVQTENSEGEELDIIRKAAERELRNVIRRVKREFDTETACLKYIAITSDMDGKTGEAVRIHHHLIVPDSAKELFVEKWKELGSVNWTPLSDRQDYTPIAAYFIRQVRRLPDAKKYITSRNLIRPEPKDRIVNSGTELRVPHGGEILHRNEFKPGRPQYIRYILPLEKRKKPVMESERRNCHYDETEIEKILC